MFELKIIEGLFESNHSYVHTHLNPQALLNFGLIVKHVFHLKTLDI